MLHFDEYWWSETVSPNMGSHHCVAETQLQLKEEEEKSQTFNHFHRCSQQECNTLFLQQNLRDYKLWAQAHACSVYM